MGRVAWKPIWSAPWETWVMPFSKHFHLNFAFLFLLWLPKYFLSCPGVWTWPTVEPLSLSWVCFWKMKPFKSCQMNCFLWQMPPEQKATFACVTRYSLLQLWDAVREPTWVSCTLSKVPKASVPLLFSCDPVVFWTTVFCLSLYPLWRAAYPTLSQWGSLPSVLVSHS